LPDADLDAAADAAVSAAYGSAGERCMAISAVVAVGAIGDELVQKIRDNRSTFKTPPDQPMLDLTTQQSMVMRYLCCFVFSYDLDLAQRERR
ncbi:aldehyde dehydrogenase family protein, partial [Streptomyces sp. SP18ES09]